MDETVAKVRLFIEQNSLLFDDESPVIVGLSGGADSVALATILSELGYTIVCAHCNFHLRREESNRDCVHAHMIAEMLSSRFESIDFDASEHSRVNSISIEEACRNLRYDWFAELLQKHNAQAIAIGHNRNDDIETFLFNLQRGTGLSGLRGIRPANDRRVVRPLLPLLREEIEAYLNRRNIPYIIDSSNLANEFSRNKLRNIVIPEFKKSFPNVERGISETIAHLSEVNNAYRQFIEEKRLHYVDSSGRINLKELIANEPLASLLIYEWLKGEGLSRTQADRMISSKSGSVFQTDISAWQIDHGILNPVVNFEKRDPATLLSIQEISADDLIIYPDPDIVYFNSAVLEGEPLTVRYWKVGDRIQPFGMTGTKKVSDIFNDAKISCRDKESIPLLCKGDTILWVAGIRRSSHFPIDPECRKIIRVVYCDPSKYIY